MKKFLSFSVLLVASLYSSGQRPAVEVIMAEKSFAKMAFEQNMQAAVLHYMSDSSVIEEGFLHSTASWFGTGYAFFYGFTPVSSVRSSVFIEQ
jgi:hypothetical protein